MVGEAVQGVMVQASAVGADFAVGALGADVTILLASITMDGFTDVFTDSGPVAENKLLWNGTSFLYNQNLKRE